MEQEEEEEEAQLAFAGPSEAKMAVLSAPVVADSDKKKSLKNGSNMFLTHAWGQGMSDVCFVYIFLHVLFHLIY